MKLPTLLLLTIVVAGCVSAQHREYNAWAVKTKPLAEAGQMKWSDYYKEAYDRITATPSATGKGAAMERTNNLLTAALAYESGTISKDVFDGYRRSVEAAAQREQEADSASRSAALGRAMQSYGDTKMRQADQQRATIKTPVRTSCRTVLGEMVCDTQ